MVRLSKKRVTIGEKKNPVVGERGEKTRRPSYHIVRGQSDTFKLPGFGRTKESYQSSFTFWIQVSLLTREDTETRTLVVHF